MSRIVITGAGGWLGGLLAQALYTENKRVELILADISHPSAPAGATAHTLQVDLTKQHDVDQLFEHGAPDVIYCMHGIMSRGSEDNFDLGMEVNVNSVKRVLDAARSKRTSDGKLIKVVFTSSLAVYGGPLPDVVDHATLASPQGAYGTGKLISEILVNEYTRRGLIDGRILRLPTIVIRPGPPSAATSAFISGIVREPLKSVRSTCPIGSSLNSPELTNLNVWLASPPTTIQNFVIAKDVPASSFLPHSRIVCLPGFTASIKEILNALEQVAGEETLNLVDFKDDEMNRTIVSSWPARFDNSYPLSLGFVADKGGIVPVVQQFRKDVEAGLA